MRKITLNPKKILIRMPNWIGDLVMATPLLTDLRKKFPDASITAMCKEPLSDLLKEDADIDELFSFKKPKSSFLHKERRRNIIQKLREGNYDLGILTTNSFSSVWWFYEGDVKNRIGFSKGIKTLLLNKRVPLPPNDEHLVETYKRLLTPLGISASKTLPRIYLKETEIDSARELLKQRNADKSCKLVGIHAGASYGPAKRWPEENFFQLAKILLLDPEMRVVFVGDEQVTPFAKKVARALGDKIIDLTGTTSLRGLCSLIKLCDVFVTNDSGPMHIAAALQVPLVALFGSTSPVKTGPYKHGETIFKNVACAPCFKRVCPINFPCMKKIGIDEVYEKIISLI